MNHQRLLSSLFVTMLLLGVGSAAAQERVLQAPVVESSFTYQGVLQENGIPATGNFDLRFMLHDAPVAGSQLGSALTLEDVAVTQGQFLVSLDFGPGVFDGGERWLEIGVRAGSSTGSFDELTPRQPLTSVPHALFAAAAPWSGLSGVPAELADGDADTTYSAGTGLVLDGSTFSLDTSSVYTQTQVDALLAGKADVDHLHDGRYYSENELQTSGEASVHWNNLTNVPTDLADGDTDTTYSAGSGIAMAGTTVSVDTAVVQARVTDRCAVGSTIGAINADGSVVCRADGPLPRSQPPSPTISTTLDRTGIVGRYTSITIGTNGLPLISYYDESNGDLKVAHCSNIACTGATTSTLDSTGDVGWYTSITIGADGLPVISYYDVSNTDLKVAHCSDMACTGATISTLDRTGDVGWYTSITIGADGLPVISYYDESNGDLKVAHCSNIACTGATTSTLDSTIYVGAFTSITIGADGLPVISYFDGNYFDLKVAHCSNIACTSATISTLDGPPDAGRDTSITIGVDGLPVISYRDGINGNLKVAHCSNIACTSATTSTLDGPGCAGRDTSITIGADGLPLISYYDPCISDLKVAHCSDIACTSAITTALDRTGDVGAFTSITIGADGLPLISYYDASSGDLKVAHCSNPFCTPYFRRR